MMGPVDVFDRHERHKSALIERALEGMLGMLIGSVLGLAAFAFGDPTKCLPPPDGCYVADIGLLMIGAIIGAASAIWMVAGVAYCWRQKRCDRRGGQRRVGE